jgi:Domain of unknown function (DUF2431)
MFEELPVMTACGIQNDSNSLSRLRHKYVSYCLQSNQRMAPFAHTKQPAPGKDTNVATEESKRSEKRKSSDCNSKSDQSFPIRNLGADDGQSDLLAAIQTWHCAHQERCIPCAYKIGNFDVALDTEFCRQIPNQRPELCPRHGRSDRITPGTWGYLAGQSILLVGDGDFTFSLAVARCCMPSCRVVATSYESLETLLQVYPGIQETIRELTSLGAEGA